MIRKMLLAAMPFLGVSSLYSLIEKPINEKVAIDVIFSTTSHNRICVEGGSVEKIIGDSSVFSVTLDKTTGNAFINLMKVIELPVTLTVVTGSGFVQDFSVSSGIGPSEQVILKELEEEEEPLVSSESLQAETVDLLNKILEGTVPFGYGQRPIENSDHLVLPDPLKAQPMKAFEGPFETIVVYGIKNTGKNPVVINANTIKKTKNPWAFLNVQQLDKNQQAICIMAYSKGKE